MGLNEYVRVLRKRWRLITAAALVGLCLAVAYIATTTRVYRATVQLFVSTQGTGQDGLSAAVAGSQFSQARVTSYAQIVNTPPITEAVVQRLNLPLTPQDLAPKITSAAIVNTVLINVSVNDTSPQRAADIANAVGTRFTEVVTNLERPNSGALSLVKVSVVRAASVPGGPVSPNRKVDLALGLFLGLLAGVAAAVLRETLDTSIRRPDQMQELTGLATLGVIAFDPDAGAQPLIVEVSPHSPRSEAFRQLRTNLQFVDVDRPLHSLVVTSAVPREGKSTTTTNLALTLARAGLRVALVEGDLRRPRIGRYLNIDPNAVGMTDVLIGRLSLDDALLRYRDEQMWVLPSGATPPNPSELLGSTAMQSLMQELEKRFDIVLVDAPPLLPVTDAAVLATVTDGVLFVTRAGKTRREQVQRAVEALRSVDANLLGAVFNMVSTRGPDASAYGYGYGYGYGYSYAPDRKGHRARPATEKAVQVSAAVRDRQPPPAPASNGLASPAVPRGDLTGRAPE